MKAFTGEKFGVNFYNFAHPIDRKLCEYLANYHNFRHYKGENVVVKKYGFRYGYVVDCAFTTRFDEKTRQTRFVMTYKVAVRNIYPFRKRHYYYYKWFAEYHLENLRKYYEEDKFGLFLRNVHHDFAKSKQR